MEDKMKLYLLKRINQKISECKSDSEIVQELEALESRGRIKELLAVVKNPNLKIV
jgi:hypothetical protein